MTDVYGNIFSGKFASHDESNLRLIYEWRSLQSLYANEKSLHGDCSPKIVEKGKSLSQKFDLWFRKTLIKFLVNHLSQFSNYQNHHHPRFRSWKLRNSFYVITRKIPRWWLSFHKFSQNFSLSIPPTFVVFNIS